MDKTQSVHNVRVDGTHADYGVIVFMVAVHLLAISAIWTFSWANFTVFTIMYFATGCFGITLCYHRLLTHHSYKTPRWLERILATCGVLALQGGPIKWVAHHRLHHAHSDTPADPHNAREGFWYSHWGWLFLATSDFGKARSLQRFARDIAADPYYRFLNSVPVQLALQALLGLFFYWLGGWSMVVWGIFLRLVVVYHITWLVNSASHIWGYQTHKVDDLARNNWVVGLLAFGEGWHNNHHAFGDVAPAGYRWWEFDLTFMIIRTFSLLGLAWDIKLPPRNVRYDSVIVMPTDRALAPRATL